jgi:hypothetical protein
VEKQKKQEKSSAFRTVTLKRSVTIKAIVTDKFKEYMAYEINEAIKRSNFRMEDIQKKQKQLEGKKNDAGVANILQQLSSEKVQLEYSIAELKNRLNGIKDIQMGSEFVQGAVDGFVTVSEGDNLYEKLGGMEILIDDGVIKKIAPITAQVKA